LQSNKVLSNNEKEFDINTSVTKSMAYSKTSYNESEIKTLKRLLKNNTLPILDYALIKDDILLVSNLENYYKINDFTGFTDGVYDITQNGTISPNPEKTEIDEFVKIPDSEQLKLIAKINTSEFKEILNYLIGFAGDDELRPMMMGINIKANKDKIIFCSTDAHRLIKLQFKNQSETNEEFDITINIGFLSLIEFFNDEFIYIYTDEKNTKLVCGKRELIIRNIEGTYPKYNNVIPIESTNKIKLDVFMLNEIVEFFKKSIKKHTKFIIVKNDGEIEVSISLKNGTDHYPDHELIDKKTILGSSISSGDFNTDFENTVLFMPVMSKAEDVSIAFNYDLMNLYIKSLIKNNSPLVINYTEPSRAGVSEFFYKGVSDKPKKTEKKLKETPTDSTKEIRDAIESLKIVLEYKDDNDIRQAIETLELTLNYM